MKYTTIRNGVKRFLASIRRTPVFYAVRAAVGACIAAFGVVTFTIASVVLRRQGVCLIRLIWRNEPATTMTVGWDQAWGRKPEVCYGPEDLGRHWKAYPHRATPDRVVNYKRMNNHFARLQGLRPDTAYYFVIKDSRGVSERYWFRTAPDQPKPFTCVAGADMRSWPESSPTRRSNRMVAKLRPLFVLLGGDYTTNGDEPFHDNADEWRWWFQNWELTVSDDGRMYPVVPVMGNHEKENEILHNLFDTPHPENYYALAVGGGQLRIYALNSFLHLAPSQHEWLEQDLHEHDAVFKVALYHTPMVPHTSRKRMYTEVYDAWAGLFYTHGVNLALEGHGHVHKVTYPVRPSIGPEAYQGFVTDFANGTIYAGEGTWGSKPRKPDDRKPWTADQGDYYQILWLHFHEHHFEIRTVKTRNVDAVAALTDATALSEPDNVQLAQTPEFGACIRYPFPAIATPRHKRELRWIKRQAELTN